MAVDYNDERFTQVEADKNAAITELEDTYQGMIDEADAYYDAQIEANEQWEATQTQLQQEQTDFAISQIEQEKAQAQKDYTKEQSGAYVDWQKQSDQHGVRAEQIADMGMQNTGYSESSQVSMYNAYQNRVAVAREAFNQAVVDYNNAITQARLQNNAILAEIAATALKERTQLALEAFQYQNNLLIELTDKKLQTENMFYQRYQDVWSQIMEEEALAEQIRQFNEQMAFQREQFNWQKSQYSGGGGGGGGSGNGGGSSTINKNGSGGDSIDKDNKGGSGSNKHIDLQSVLDLGGGPVSAENLAQQEKDGKIMIVETDDRLVAVPKPSSNPLTSGKYSSTGWKNNPAPNVSPWEDPQSYLGALDYLNKGK